MSLDTFGFSRVERNERRSYYGGRTRERTENPHVRVVSPPRLCVRVAREPVSFNAFSLVAVRVYIFFLINVYFLNLYQTYNYNKRLPWTVDHLARGSMKNAVNCAS